MRLREFLGNRIDLPKLHKGQQITLSDQKPDDVEGTPRKTEKATITGKRELRGQPIIRTSKGERRVFTFDVNLDD